MNISNQRVNIIINNLNSFYSFINSIINNIKEDFSNKNLEQYYIYNKDRQYKSIKTFNKEIRDLFYNNTILNIEYWKTRGWTQEEAVFKIKEEQKRRSFFSAEKMRQLKNHDPYKWKSLINTNIEFYIEKGFTKEEAEVKRKERQRTFSKDICIKKFGKKKGTDIWKERQTKWLDSLSKTSIDNTLKDSKSSSYFKNKFGSDWIFNAIDSNSFNDKELIKKIIKNSNNIDEFCSQVVKEKTIYSLREITFVFNSNIISDYFNVSSKELKNKLIEKYGLITGKYGTIRYFNGHICRSNGEYYIAKKLKKLNIDYIYEKKYPNENWVSDFYIKENNVYVEYMWFLKNDFFSKNNKDICDDYRERYNMKMMYCLSNKLNFIFESDYKIIIKKIIENDFR
jgi:hypothetical protein